MITVNAVWTQIDSVSTGVGDNLYSLGTVGTVTVADPLRLRWKQWLIYPYKVWVLGIISTLAQQQQ